MAGNMNNVAWPLAALAIAATVTACGKSAVEKAADMERKVAVARAKLDADEEAARAAEARRQEAEMATLDAAATQRLVGMVRENMIDPASATFKGIVVKRAWITDTTGYSSDAICGVVNGKNRMGGYTGPQTFFAYRSSDGKAVVWFSGQSEPYSTIARDNARRMGCES